MNRSVILKRPLASQNDAPGVAVLFLQEAQTLARANHPAVVEIHGVELAFDRTPFIVMEDLDGRALDELLEQDYPTITENEKSTWIVELSAALAMLHSKGLKHRDLKPANIVIAGKGAKRAAKLIDFGLAEIPDTRIHIGRTSRGDPAGTSGWIAPERLSAGSAASDQSDQWAFGLIAFALFTGKDPTRPLIRSSTAYEGLRERLHEHAGIPSHLRMVIYRCLADDPSARFSSSEDLSKAVKAAVDDDVRRSIGLPRDTGITLVQEGTAPTIARYHIEAMLSRRGQPEPLRVWGYSLKWVHRLASAIETLNAQKMRIEIAVPTREALKLLADPKATANVPAIESSVAAWIGLAERGKCASVTVFRTQTVPDSLGLLIGRECLLASSYTLEDSSNEEVVLVPSDSTQREMLHAVAGPNESTHLIQAYRRRWIARVAECRPGEVHEQEASIQHSRRPT